MVTFTSIYEKHPLFNRSRLNGMLAIGVCTVQLR